MPNTAYAAHVRVGVHSWDVTYDPDVDQTPDYGLLAGVRFSWQARQDDGWPTQHDPTVLTFGVIVAAGTDFDDVDQGTTVHFTFTPDGFASPLLTFGGTVRDLVGKPHELGMLYTITAVDHLKALAELYTTSAFIANGEPTANIWTDVVKDGNLTGEGTKPFLPDPLSGDTKPLTGFGGFVFGDLTLVGSAWDVLTGIAQAATLKFGATPLYQRLVFTYQLAVSGELLAAKPFLGTWLPQGASNAPLELENGPNGWTVGGGNVDGCLMPTDAAEWSRQRIEPNVARSGGVSTIRPHTGPDIVRDVGTNNPRYLSDYTDPYWLVAGIEDPDQWRSELELAASEDPASVAGWFTLPTAMRIAVACRDIASRHTPSGRTSIVGMLGGASLTIRPGGSWRVGFQLRRTLPDRSQAGTGGWTEPADALTYAQLAVSHPTLTYAQLDPALTYRDLTFL